MACAIMTAAVSWNPVTHPSLHVCIQLLMWLRSYHCQRLTYHNDQYNILLGAQAPENNHHPPCSLHYTHITHVHVLRKFLSL